MISTILSIVAWAESAPITAIVLVFVFTFALTVLAADKIFGPLRHERSNVTETSVPTNMGSPLAVSFVCGVCESTDDPFEDGGFKMLRLFVENHGERTIRDVEVKVTEIALVQSGAVPPFRTIIQHLPASLPLMNEPRSRRFLLNPGDKKLVDVVSHKEGASQCVFAIDGEYNSLPRHAEEELFEYIITFTAHGRDVLPREKKLRLRLDDLFHFEET